MSIEDTKKYFEGFPEAPCSDTFRWVDPQGFEHLMTLRAWHINPLMTAITEAQVEILGLGGIPAGKQSVSPAPAAQVQERDENGTPVVDPEGKPVMASLPAGTSMYTVKGMYHAQTKAGKDALRVVVEEKPHNSKYGHYCFHPPFSDWKNWPLAASEGTPALFAPPPGCGHVIIRDPQDGGKYPEILEFRA